MENPRKRRFVIRRYAITLNPGYGSYYNFEKEQYVKQIFSLHKLRKKRHNPFRKSLKKKMIKMKDK